MKQKVGNQHDNIAETLYCSRITINRRNGVLDINHNITNHYQQLRYSLIQFPYPEPINFMFSFLKSDKCNSDSYKTCQEILIWSTFNDVSVFLFLLCEDSDVRGVEKGNKMDSLKEQEKMRKGLQAGIGIFIIKAITFLYIL